MSASTVVAATTRNRVRVRGLLLAALIVFTKMSADAYGQTGVPVSGTVSNSAGRPVPGIAVSLIRPALGRSSPAYTDQFGQYRLPNVPPHPTPYFMEVYWGQRLIYRKQLMVRGPLIFNVKVK